MRNRVETPSEGQGFIARHKKGLSVAAAGTAALVVAELRSVAPITISRDNGSVVIATSGSEVRGTDRRARRVPQSEGGPLNVPDCGETGKEVCYDERGSELGYYLEYCHDDAAKPVDGICVVDFTSSGETWEEHPFYNDFRHSPDK